jgi:hypothetical protein
MRAQMIVQTLIIKVKIANLLKNIDKMNIREIKKSTKTLIVISNNKLVLLKS